MAEVHIGVDVGGTNTDAVVMCGHQVAAWAKHTTTADVTTGVAAVILEVLTEARRKLAPDGSLLVKRIHIGTTHFVNAVVQRKQLATVAVIRLCGPATQALPPFTDFPTDLFEVIGGSVHMLAGGFEVDGQTAITAFDEEEVANVIKQLKVAGERHVVIVGVFSPINNSQEIKVGEILERLYPECSVTLSHQVAQLGLLERENAAVLNESLKPLCAQTVAALSGALADLGLTCPLYLTQNDGTLISAEQSLQMPVLTFASGPTNSMRGAAFLSGVNDAVVVDIGGTSTDIGMLMCGFPREASFKVKVGNVRTNFRMPDVLSFGLGGGSLVHIDGEKVTVGPTSVGYRLQKEGLVFGGSTLTTSDVAVAAGMVEMGEAEHLKGKDLTPEVTAKIIQHIRVMVEEVIDQVKISAESVPVILVGGGSVLIDSTKPLNGTTQVIKPPNYNVANAVGAALSQVSGALDIIQDLSGVSRDAAIQTAKDNATAAAVSAGADPATVQITDVSDVPLAYFPGKVTRLTVRAVGNLLASSIEAAVHWHHSPEGSIKTVPTEGVQQEFTSTGQSLQEGGAGGCPVEVPPRIDPDTGIWDLSEWDLGCIAIGAGILGCGGGGSPYIGHMRALKKLKEGKKIRLITPERLQQSMGPLDVVLPVAFMGAPTVGIECICSGNEGVHTVKAMNHLITNNGYHVDSVCLNDGQTVQEEDGTHFIDPYTFADDAIEGAATALPGGRVVALMSAEAGGSNCMEPLVVAADLGIPVADCDLMGRAFPELQQNTPMIYGHPAYPACLSDKHGHTVVLLKTPSPKHLEDHFRKICIEMGCMAALGVMLLGADQLVGGHLVTHSVSRAWRLGNAVMATRSQHGCITAAILKQEGGMLLCTGKCSVLAAPVLVSCRGSYSMLLRDEAGGRQVVPHSISRAWRLGNAVLGARAAKTSTVQMILRHEGGQLLCVGKVVDVQRQTTGGFARGLLRVEGSDSFSGQQLLINFQNENLVAKQLISGAEPKVLACVPDLISVVEADSGEPISTEDMRYGLRVAVVAMAAHPLLCSPEALAVVGPQAFGYPPEEVTFTPIGEYTPHAPVPPL